MLVATDSRHVGLVKDVPYTKFGCISFSTDGGQRLSKLSAVRCWGGRDMRTSFDIWLQQLRGYASHDSDTSIVQFRKCLCLIVRCCTG